MNHWTNDLQHHIRFRFGGARGWSPFFKNGFIILAWMLKHISRYLFCESKLSQIAPKLQLLPPFKPYLPLFGTKG